MQITAMIFASPPFDNSDAAWLEWQRPPDGLETGAARIDEARRKGELAADYLARAYPQSGSDESKAKPVIDEPFRARIESINARLPRIDAEMSRQIAFVSRSIAEIEAARARRAKELSQEASA
jgi:hypothetical protein